MLPSIALLGYVFLSVFTLFILSLGWGYWISCLDPLSKTVYLLGPARLVSFLILIGWHLSHQADWPTDLYSYVLLAILSIPNLTVFLFKKHRIKFRKECLRRFSQSDHLIAVFTALLTILVLSWVMLTAPILAPISIGNNDLADYSTIERVLKESPRDCKTGFICTDPSIRNKIESEVFGAYYFGALQASALGLETYQAQSVYLLTFIFLTNYFLFFFCRRVLSFSTPVSGGIVLLYGAHPILFYVLYHGYKSQMLAMSLMIPVVLEAHVLPLKEWGGRKWIGISSLCLLLFGMSLTYPHMVLVLWSMIGGSWLLERRPLGAVVLTWLSVPLGVFLLSWHRAYLLFAAVFRLNQVQAGWFIPAFSPERIFGFFWPLPDALNTLPLGMHALRSAPYLILIGVGGYGLYRLNRKRFMHCSFWVGTILGAYLILIIRNRTNDEWGGYKPFKWISFFLPILVPCSLGFLSQLYFKKPNLSIQLRRIQEFFIVMLFGISLGSTLLWIQVRSNPQARMTLDPEKINLLKKIEKDPQITSINLTEQQWWDQMWSINFLGRKSLYLKTSTYYPATLLEGIWDFDGLHLKLQSGRKDCSEIGR